MFRFWNPLAFTNGYLLRIVPGKQASWCKSPDKVANLCGSRVLRNLSKIIQLYVSGNQMRFWMAVDRKLERPSDHDKKISVQALTTWRADKCWDNAGEIEKLAGRKVCRVPREDVAGAPTKSNGNRCTFPDSWQLRSRAKGAEIRWKDQVHVVTKL